MLAEFAAVTAYIISMGYGGGNLNAGILLVDNTGTVLFAANRTANPSGNALTDYQSAVNTAAISYASANGYTITADDVIFALKTTIPPRTYTNPARSLNSAFQISTTQDTQVSYAVDIAAVLSLTSGQTGTVILEYADDSGFTTNVVTVQTSKNGNTGTLAIGLGLTQTTTVTLTGMVPAAKYVRLRTVNTTGSPSFTMSTSQEVLL